MSFFKYLIKKSYGLPTHDSIELIRAMEYRPSESKATGKLISIDIASKPTDPFMFGAISVKPSGTDYLTSFELEKKAKKIYESAKH